MTKVKLHGRVYTYSTHFFTHQRPSSARDFALNSPLGPIVFRPFS